MAENRIFKPPGVDRFNSEKDREDYLERCRCAICHEKLEDGDEFQLRSIEEDPTVVNCQAVIVHRKCIDGDTDE